MKQSLELRQHQKLTMTPQLQQAIRLLQMSTSELTEELQQAHESNPLLEIAEEEFEPAPLTSDRVEPKENKDDGAQSDDQEFLSQLYSGVSGADAYKYDDFESQVIAESPPTLHETLASQAVYLFSNEDDRRIAHYIIQNINEAGYLDISLEELELSLSDRDPVTVQQIEWVLSSIQKLDPAGVGARNPQECLMLQLDSLDQNTPGLTIAKIIVEFNLDLLASKAFSKLRQVLSVSDFELKNAVSIIQGLNPHPGYSVGSVSVNYITPDILVEKKQTSWLARFNPNALPKLSIHTGYQDLINQGGIGEFGQMKEQLQQAKWLMSNIEKRHQTILSVAKEIVERQQDFFHFGSSKMKPLTLSQISTPLGVHESTVSRATTGKYLSAPQGIYELKYFFSSGVNKAEGGMVSSVAIQAEIKKIIENERPAKPQSDEGICNLLEQKGIKVARRTIAKYREQMGIPSSSKRKSNLMQI